MLARRDGQNLDERLHRLFAWILIVCGRKPRRHLDVMQQGVSRGRRRAEEAQVDRETVRHRRTGAAQYLDCVVEGLRRQEGSADEVPRCSQAFNGS